MGLEPGLSSQIDLSPTFYFLVARAFASHVGKILH